MGKETRLGWMMMSEGHEKIELALGLFGKVKLSFLKRSWEVHFYQNIPS